jgi:PleD family two-component response regulator
MESWHWVALLTVSGAAGMLYQQNRRLRRTQAQLAGQVREMAEKNRVLEELAVTDGLTGLYNRRYFEQRLISSASRCSK